jgi:tripartite-type tricarboxylate transporter receptor subunit TctC
MHRHDTHRRGALRRLAAAGAATALPGLAAAQAWPTRPIRLIVGFAPGGGTDIVARTMGARLSELLGAQIVVENRAGASGMIGADTVAKAAPDGYTLLMGHANSNVIAPNVVAKAPYDPATDFTPIHYIGYVPNVLAVHPGLAARSVDELVALARSKPGVLTYASSGVGSSQHLAGALFAKLTGVQVAHVPYKGSGQAIGDLLAGQVSMNFDTMPPVLPHIQSGKLRALAVSTPARVAQLPDVPTFVEVGIRGFDVTNWYSVMGPKGMPRELVARIADAVRRSLDDAGVRGKLEPQGLIYTGPRNPEEFAAFIRAELAKYATLVKDLGVRAE